MRTLAIKYLTKGSWRSFLISLFIIPFILTSCQSKTASHSRPNIVLIVADDLGYGDLGCYGATRIKTPNIDSLSAGGMQFNNAYVVSSLCSPSRYSILTGQYSWRTRLKYGVLKYYDKPLITRGQTTIASMLKKAGYYTACIGKWHLGMDWPLNEQAPENPEQTVFDSWEINLHRYIDFKQPIQNGPLDRGFDYFYGMAGSNNMQPYTFIEDDHAVEVPSIKEKPYDHYEAAERAPSWNINTVNQKFTKKAVEVINDHFQIKNDDKPLFLYFPTSAIHRPCLPTFTQGKSKAGLRGDIVEELDWTVGEVVKALKKNNAFENTLLIFTSDNGPRPGDPALWMDIYKDGDYRDLQEDYFDNYKPEYINEHGNKIWSKGWYTYDHRASGNLLGFKSDSWDGGLKVPFIFRWPEHIPPGSINNNQICSVDLLATLGELLEISLNPEEGEDSYSFLSNLRNPNAPQVRESMILTGGASGAKVAISNGWKFIEAAPKDRWPETYYPEGPSAFEDQLYHLNNDISEQNNLYKQNPDKVTDLKNLIKEVSENKAKENRKVQENR